MTANEEFSDEVRRLYCAEESWEQESSKLKAEYADHSEKLRSELKNFQDKWVEERARLLKQENMLVESVRVLTFDNERFLQEREREQLNSSKSHQVNQFYSQNSKHVRQFQELKAEYDERIMKLEATLSCLRSVLKSELILKNEIEIQIDELTQAYKNMEQKIIKLKEGQKRDIYQMKEKFEQQIKIIENKSELIAAKNFEHAVENVGTILMINPEIICLM